MKKQSTNFIHDKVIWASLLLILFIAWKFQNNLGQVASLFLSEIILLIPFVVLALVLAAYVEASQASHLIQNIYQKNTKLTILGASILGTLIPFCSCTTFPVILSLLMARISIAPIVAFLLAAPVMDIQMAALSYGALGGKITFFLWASAVLIGWIGGFFFLAYEKKYFTHPLKENITPRKSCCSKDKNKAETHQTEAHQAKEETKKEQKTSSCCSSKQSTTHKHHEAHASNSDSNVTWNFWHSPEKRTTFKNSLKSKSFFIGKWILLASLINILLILMHSEQTITNIMNHLGLWSLPLAMIIAIPTYTNGYAATLLAATFLHNGVPAGTIVTYMLAGAMSCLPTFVLFLSSLKARVIIPYYTISLLGALVAGFIFSSGIL